MADDSTFEKDLEWLRELNKKSWKVHHAQYSRGRQTSYGHSEDLPITKEDRTKLLNILEKYQDTFIFEPGGGVFGFGVSLSAGIIKWPTYPGVPLEVEWVICVTSKQMFPKLHGRDADDAYATFEKFSHTEANKKLREKAGLKESIKGYAYYDY